jgi:hypothetical protein
MPDPTDPGFFEGKYFDGQVRRSIPRLHDVSHQQ